MQWVIVAVPDLNGILRGKAVARAAFERAVKDGGLPCTDLVLTTDAQDRPIVDGRGDRTLGSGGDLRLVPEPRTLTIDPWRPGWATCLAAARWRDGSVCEISPRDVCRSVLASPELGATVRAAFEYEFRLYDIESGRPASPAASYSQRLLGELDGFIKDVAQSTAAWRVELEAVHTEAAPGLMEVSVGACDGLEAADVAIALRSCIREAARRHGLRAGFAAKPVTGEEGSGGHLHISLGDPDGRNLFACDALADKPLPAVMRHAIAGLLAHLGSMSALYNPYHNSYKRLIPGWFAPVRADWAIDDRDAAVRVVAGDQPQTTHLELRRPGADANPYLVLAAAVVSIAEGLQQELELPPDASCGAPPTDLRLALVAFAADARARERLGERFCEYWGISREWELSAFNDVITPWELARAGELMHR